MNLHQLFSFFTPISFFPRLCRSTLSFPETKFVYHFCGYRKFLISCTSSPWGPRFVIVICDHILGWTVFLHIRFKHKIHLVRVWKRSWFSLKYLLLSPQTSPSTLPPPDKEKKSVLISEYCGNINVIHMKRTKLTYAWFIETHIANILLLRLGWVCMRVYVWALTRGYGCPFYSVQFFSK